MSIPKAPKILIAFQALSLKEEFSSFYLHLLIMREFPDIEKKRRSPINMYSAIFLGFMRDSFPTLSDYFIKKMVAESTPDINRVY